MIYNKKEIEKILSIFNSYLFNSQHLDLLLSDKMGYVLLCIDTVNDMILDSILIRDPEELVEQFICEMIADVLSLNDYEHDKADPLELEEIRRRVKPYIDQLPDYAESIQKLIDDIS